MSSFSNPLDNIKIASPCSADWNAMIGDDRTRFCGQCKLNVFNLSGMTRTEAESLIINANGRLCVRFYRRADGTILTKDCPVGLAAIRKRISRMATAAVSLLFGILGGLGITALFANRKTEPRVMGKIAIEDPKVGVMGDIATPPILGNVAIKESNNDFVGRVTTNDEAIQGAMAHPNASSKKKR
jgi:hypothetical protein